MPPKKKNPRKASLSEEKPDTNKDKKTKKVEEKTR